MRITGRIAKLKLSSHRAHMRLSVTWRGRGLTPPSGPQSRSGDSFQGAAEFLDFVSTGPCIQPTPAGRPLKSHFHGGFPYSRFWKISDFQLTFLGPLMAISGSSGGR